jgi:transketolase C-terminal domain/subunit
MRRTLSVYMKPENYLLHADMWRFDTSAKVVNCGLGESNLLNVAGGLAGTGATVYIYGVCGFIIHRYEQLKFSCRDFGGNHGKIILCNAGKFGYSQFGTGHTLDDDLSLMDVLEIDCYKPDTVVDLVNSLDGIGRRENGVYYVRLGRDS